MEKDFIFILFLSYFLNSFNNVFKSINYLLKGFLLNILKKIKNFDSNFNLKIKPKNMYNQINFIGF